MDCLQASHYCVAVDLLGFGDSDSPAGGDYSLDSQGQRVLAVADALKLGRFALMGHSMGGQIALLMAGKLAPQRITHLINVAGVLTGALCWWPRIVTKNQMRLGMIAPFLVPPTAFIFRLPFITSMAYSAWFYKMLPLKDWVEDRERTLQAGIITSGYPAVCAIQHTDVTPYLPNITAKTLVMLGRDDSVVPVREGGKAAMGITGARIQWFEECGHFPHFEQPEIFNRAVVDFIT